MKRVMSRTELIARLKDCEGPCRETDDRIWRWVNESKLNRAAPGWQYDLLDPPAYTESLDAARSLIPFVSPDERMDFILEHVNGGLTIGSRVGHDDRDRTAWGANDAIALSRGALEAHGDLT